VVRRPWGKDDIELSILGMGGIVVKDLEQSEANRIVAATFERGVNYFDVAPSYGDAEEKLGPALEPYRKEVFLACNTAERDSDEAERELERSLKRLRTDHFDLYQLHGLASGEEVDRAFQPGGAMETLEAARREGKARFLGFSAHSVEAAVEALNRFEFDSVLFPFNFVCWYGGFGSKVMCAAEQGKAARLALKSMARGPWSSDERRHSKCWYEPFEDPEMAELAFRWTLSQDVTAAVSTGQHQLLPMMLDIADRFRPVTTEEEQRLHEMAKGLTPIFP